LTLDIAFFLPFSEVSQSGRLCWVLHPLNDLQHCDKVDIVPVNHLVDELDELLDKSLVLLEPGGVEMQAQWGSVGVEVTVEVVPQHRAELVWGQDV